MEKIYNDLEKCIEVAMEECSKFANEGVDKDIGGPFGAAIIQIIKEKNKNDKYKIIVIERNSVVRDNNPTSHAEMNAIKKASEIFNRFDLSDCILVSTAKSCPMCLATSCWAKIPKIYYGVGYEYASKYGFKDNDILEYFQGKNNIISEINYENEFAKEPFEHWAKKENRIDY